MHDRTLLGGVDGLTGKHGVTALCHTALARQVHQQRLGRGVDAVFGQIGKNMRRGLAEFGEALGRKTDGSLIEIMEAEEGSMRVIGGPAKYHKS